MTSQSPSFTFAGVGGPIPFTANRWKYSFGDTLKMNSTFPQLFTADNNVNLTASGQLAHVIGATSVTSWPVLELFDTFPSAHMTVAVR